MTPALKAYTVMNINIYAVQGRYPDSSLLPTIEETKGFHRLANQVKALVEERIVPIA